ncbi:His Kinase A (phospho-acceptor) domain-containing protein [Sphingopyxis terrae subsp. ummariensis]|uniref:histidine kinase n=3 Tax=Sphingopyxis terrae TaxID=33052 RepID=A0A1Y6FSV7_9SPHN|nr:His Kinase A (phospho-acceptor) domain-containing protein [Sphingopyxis terrae subsp. ummariensis]
MPNRGAETATFMESKKIASLGRDRRASRVIVALLALGFVALLVAAAATYWTQRQNEEIAQRVSHTLLVEARLGAFASANERMETARRGLLLTNDPRFAAIMDKAEASARAQLGDLGALIRDNPEQVARVARLRNLIDAYGAYNRTAIGGGIAARRAVVEGFASDTGVAYVRDVRAVVDAMMADELGLLRERESKQRRTQALFNTTLLITGLLILAVAAITLLLIRRNLVDLRLSREQLRQLNESLEELVDARTAELSRANAEIQRFAYIVSHDLRSPLVNVMGFTAELEAARKAIADYLARSEEGNWQAPDPATRLAIEEDLPEAIGFIRSSTQKMDRLINAILNLSRQGRRSLAPERLDLGLVVQAIADSLEHRIQETGTRLEIGDLPQIVNDRLAVEQILSNLIENALKYLKPGRAGVIAVSGRCEYGRAFVEVKDNGRGIDPRDHDRIFDLFRRSGTQDQPGEGIGLAHARALAYRLGGTIDVQSALDEGSIFRLTLPVEWKGGEENA